MRNMVIDHGDTIKIIDSELLPAAESAPVKQHLEETRRVVSAHFERAHAVSSSSRRLIKRSPCKRAGQSGAFALGGQHAPLSSR